MAEQLGISTDLSARSLMRAAVEETNLSDFGDEWFVPHLDELGAALTNTASQVNTEGLYLFRRRFVGFLKTRLEARKIWREHPEIEDEMIAPPVVIIGLPRTGTTKLSRMICAGGDFEFLRLWQAIDPISPQSRDSSAKYSQTVLDHMNVLNNGAPTLNAVHEYEVDELEEEVALMQHSFLTKMNDAEARIPGFVEYVDRNDVRPVYRELRDWMKFLQWQNGGSRKTWLLKCVYHNEFLAELVETFPGATLIQLHRDVENVVTSWASLVEQCRSIYADSVDPREVGADTLEFWRNVSLQTEVIRRDRPDIVVHDFQFRDVVRGIRPIIEQIYGLAGLEPTEQSWFRMSNWEIDNQQHKHGRHDYSVQKFGLTRTQINDSMSPYLERYPLSEN